MNLSRSVALIGLFWGTTVLTQAAVTPEQVRTLPPPAGRIVDFAKDIQPLLAERCYSCHGPEKQKSDLRWDSKASVFKTGEHGPILDRKSTRLNSSHRCISYAVF